MPANYVGIAYDDNGNLHAEVFQNDSPDSKEDVQLRDIRDAMADACSYDGGRMVDLKIVKVNLPEFVAKAEPANKIDFEISLGS